MTERAAVPIQPRVAPRFRPTTAEVDLSAIGANLTALRPPRAAVMAVVKANAYGHGEVEVARAALASGATWLGVALVEEGLRLRQAGVEAPILVLTEFPRGSEAPAVAAGLTPAVYTSDGARALARVAAATGRPLGVHLKIDTGMHRVGLRPRAAVPFVAALAAANLRLDALWSHFARADEPDDPATRNQLDLFLRTAEALERRGHAPPMLHIANSAAAVSAPATHLDMVRIGIAMYGLAPGPAVETPPLRPALSWRTRAAMVKRVAAQEAISYGMRYRLSKESTIVTVPVGYADGYPRRLSGRAEVLIRGRRYPVAGTISMDQVTVDCADDPVEEGDEVVLLGRQGDQEITADEIAGWLGTINYEVVCGIGCRVPRTFTGA